MAIPEMFKERYLLIYIIMSTLNYSFQTLSYFQQHILSLQITVLECTKNFICLSVINNLLRFAEC